LNEDKREIEDDFEVFTQTMQEIPNAIAMEIKEIELKIKEEKRIYEEIE
jgi:hypothetical protein